MTGSYADHFLIYDWANQSSLMIEASKAPPRRYVGLRGGLCVILDRRAVSLRVRLYVSNLTRSSTFLRVLDDDGF